MDTAEGGAETKAEKSSSKPEIGVVMEMETCDAGAVDGVRADVGLEVADAAQGSSVGAEAAAAEAEGCTEGSGARSPLSLTPT